MSDCADCNAVIDLSGSALCSHCILRRWTTGDHTRPGWNPPPHLPPQDTADHDDWGPHGTINDAA